MTIRLLLLAVLLLGFGAPALAAESAVVRSPRAVASLISDSDAVRPGATVQVGLRLLLAPGWHTYWKNPGDAGVAPEIELLLPAGATAGPIRWPVPERVPEGPIMTYGYSGEVVLPVAVTFGETVGPVEARASWLVCEKICVPEEGVFRLDLPVGPARASREAPLFAAAERAMPVAAPWPAVVGADGTLLVTAAEIAPGRVADAWFLADVAGQIETSAPQAVSVRPGELRLGLKPGSEFKPGTPLAGVLVLVDGGGQRSAFAVTAAPGVVAPVVAGISVWQAVLFAFLGGLILNLMPCVFPVLAMKAVGLVGLSGKEGAAARLGAGFYTLGVRVAFGALGGALVVARAAGAASGWGFQFQSPVFVAVMAWVMFAIGLNLSGVFEVGGRLAGVGQGVAGRRGLAGYFGTGLLAALVATPCTAPFMGAAIGAALAAPAVGTAGIFLALGLGLAAPYVAVAWFPALMRWLPRPGNWMVVLKQALAFPMYAAAAWLVWVLSQSVGPGGVLVGASGILLVGLAGWAWGMAQAGQGRRVGRVVAGVALAVAVALLPGLGVAERAPAGVAEAGTEAYSAARLAALRGEGRPVFVNMTAAWCITCLVNERVALRPEAVRAAFAANGVTYMKGDWTRQDPEISAFLRQHGRDGVPLYVLYPARGAAEVLPQILTEGTVLEALARAGARAGG